MLKDDFKPTIKREKRYNCEICSKPFKDKFTWKVHLATHTGEKPYVCDQCEASFAMKSRLTSTCLIHLPLLCELVRDAANEQHWETKHHNHQTNRKMALVESC
uniref:C2H2-type domain-containing protein n=1 Tax=Tetranychus urticae TaxID=32264 RepID=T1JY57_TETUR